MITADGGGYHERHYNKPENAVPLTYKEKKVYLKKVNSEQRRMKQCGMIENLQVV